MTMTGLAPHGAIAPPEQPGDASPSPSTPPTVAILEDPELAPAVAALLNEALGDIHSVEMIAEELADEGAVVVGIWAGAKLVGAASAYLAGEYETESLAEVWPAGVPAPPTPLGMLESAALLPAWRGRGLGRAMVERRVAWLADKGARAVGAYCWESEAERRSRPVLEAVGFEPVGVVKNLWEGTTCPYCGNSCRCDAMIELLKLS